jgi:hypothetical protein
MELVEQRKDDKNNATTSETSVNTAAMPLTDLK